MEVELKGKQNMRKRAIKKWLKFKELYDKGMAVEDIARKVRKKNGSHYARTYVYKALRKLSEV